MELEQFISTTLVQIANGIQSAADQLHGTRAIVNPRNVSTAGAKGEQIYGYLNVRKKFFKVVQRIDFDVAVTAAEGSEANGGIGIRVGSIGVGATGKSENSNTTVSRIRFSVPMVLPMEDAPHDNEDPET
ncbi:hypothetical protein T35B1_17506 [Salinisphaera shabanensis T35B1]|uniref:hypothetical protein n=1 Tax=Salinisphaera shabanensis TaxID=180542 RepID=UPI00333E5DE6